MKNKESLCFCEVCRSMIQYDESDIYPTGDYVCGMLALEIECPECGKMVEHEGGCVICRHCGFSKCN